MSNSKPVALKSAAEAVGSKIIAHLAELVTPHMISAAAGSQITVNPQEQLRSFQSTISKLSQVSRYSCSL